MNIFLTFLALLLPFSATAAQSDSIRLEQSNVQILSSVDSIQPGDEFLIGVHIDLDDHWHTYTYDPGDAGIPFDATWQLPDTLTISPTYWPPHETFDEAGLTTYGFSDEVTFTYKVRASSTLAETSTISAEINYLICKDICIPQSTTIRFSLPIGDSTASAHAETLTMWHEKSILEPTSPTPLSGGDGGGSPQTQTDPSPRNSPPPAPSASEGGIFSYLLLALLGGIILNLMPCVFPVLSLKALAIAKHSDAPKKEIHREGMAYTLGILTCFWVLAGLLIGFQQAGESIGWGFQFQSPGFVAIMALLLFFIGLNLSGLFELPTLLGGLAGKIGAENSAKNSYFTGILAALVATPCTAPFMATAVGFALSQPAFTSLLIFTFLGLGLALPFILISFIPGALKWLPKPGAWMETFKHFLAFPMYLSAIWLLWVLGTQTGMEGIIATLLITFLIIFLVWAKGRCGFKSSFCSVANLFIIAALLALLTEALGSLQPSADNAASGHESSFSTEKLAALRQSGTPVFVDATASWCITCKVNYATSISNAEVQQAFKDQGITYMVADWTNKNTEITNYLASYGYKGVPLYVYYAPGQEGTILPQILTPALILQTIALSNH